MKNLRTAIIGVAAMFFGLCAAAQNEKSSVPVNEPDYNKPKLFASLPDNIPVDINLFVGLLANKVGSTVNLTVNGSFQFRGQIVSAASKYENSIQSTVIRSTNYAGATLSFTKVTNAQDGSVTFTGRIISMQHGDLYELQNKSGQYSFVKKNFYDLVNE